MLSSIRGRGVAVDVYVMYRRSEPRSLPRRCDVDVDEPDSLKVHMTSLVYRYMHMNMMAALALALALQYVIA